MTNLLALPTGTVLADDYRIERVLGAGGFGITYLAEEKPLARLVTIKEYFPADYAARDGDVEASPRSQDCEGDYRWGLDRFLEEAQTLAKFDHPNIVRVYRYFRANNTGYMVLHFEEGQSFKSWLKSLGRAPRQHELDRIISPLLDALELIHNADFLHRDIAPDNIIIRKDGSPVLIDFGSARGEIAQHSMTVSALVKPGYSPYEQYATTSRQQGPWSDIYSFGATLYQAVTSKRPPDAPSRMVADELVPARDAALSSYRPTFLAGIDRALALEVTDRPRSIVAWRTDLLRGYEAATTGPTTAARDIDAEAAIPLPAAEPVKAKKPAAQQTPSAGMPRLRDMLAGLKLPSQPAKADAPALPRPAKARAVSKPKLKLPRLKRHALPRPMRIKQPRYWRPLVVKLLIGLGVASAAVAVQDRFPRPAFQSAQTAPSPNGEVAMAFHLKAHNGAVDGIGFTGDGRWMLSAGADATLKVWNAATRSLVRSIELGGVPVTAFATDGRRAITGHKDGTIALWDLDSGNRIVSYRRNEASVWSVTFAGGPDRFAAGAHDWAIALFDVRTPQEGIQLLEGHDNAVQTLAYSAKGPFLASGGADRTVKLWNPTSLNVIRTYRGHPDFVTATAFAPDGRIIASASLDGSIRLWSTTSHRIHRILRGHRGRVTGLAFSPDGQLLVSASEDGTVKLWEFRRGRSARTVSHNGDVHGIAFSPDGRRLAAGGGDGVIKVWDVSSLRPGS
jgi:serine/threonine protein kinase